MRKREPYELAEVLITPGTGPYIREWNYRGQPRDLDAVDEPLDRLKGELTQCYRFARQRDPGLEEPLKGRLLLNEWGRVASLSFQASPRAAEAARCFEGFLLGRDLSGDDFPRSNLRWTEFPITLHLKRSGLRRPHDVPLPTSGAVPGPPPGVCFMKPQTMDKDTHPEKEVEVSDFDEQQSIEEQEEDCRRALQKWNESGQSGARPECQVRRRIQPEVVRGTAFAPGPVLHQLARRLRYNVGAYRDCYLAEAIQPDDFRHAKHFLLSFSSTGFVTRVMGTESDRNVPLHRCLEKALAEVWVDESAADFEVKVRLRLGSPKLQVMTDPPRRPVPPRASVAEVERLAEAALAEGDGERAARRFASLLREGSEHPNRCQWHVGMLAAVGLRAPWGDARLKDAIAALNQHTRVHPGDPGLVACLGRAAPIIVKYLQEDSQGDLHKLALTLPGLPNRRELRLRLAELFEDNSFKRAGGYPHQTLARSECEAGAIYMQLAEEECTADTGRCWLASAAVRAFERCSGTERSFTRHHYPSRAIPVPPKTQLLFRARRFLLDHSKDEIKERRISLLRSWAWEYAYQWGQFEEAKRLLRELIAHGPNREALEQTNEELRDIEAFQEDPKGHRKGPYL